MTDHDKLREAINSLCSACQKTLVIGPSANRMTRTVWEDDLIRVLAAAESTLPRTKMVEVWHLEWVAKIDGQNIPQISVHTDKASAERWRDCQQNAPACIGYSCIRVTGPHQQEVPA